MTYLATENKFEVSKGDTFCPMIRNWRLDPLTQQFISWLQWWCSRHHGTYIFINDYLAIVFIAPCLLVFLHPFPSFSKHYFTRTEKAQTRLHCDSKSQHQIIYHRARSSAVSKANYISKPKATLAKQGVNGGRQKLIARPFIKKKSGDHHASV